MPTRADEFLPRPELITRTVELSLAPYVYEIEGRLNRPVGATLSVCVLDQKVVDRPIVSKRQPADTHQGEIRLRFRRTYRDDRILSFAEARYSVQPDSKVSWLPRGGSTWCGFLWAAEILGVAPQEEIRQHRTWIDRWLYDPSSWRDWDWK